MALADAAVDVAPAPDTATVPDVAALAPEVTAETDVGRASDDAPPADAGPQPAPLLAKGKFSDVTALLGPPLAVDPGVKGGPAPFSSAGLFLDVDKDDLVDVIFTDGLQQVVLGRALAPWKWLKIPIFQTKVPGLNALAATDGDGDGYPEIVVAGSHLHYLVRKQGDDYADLAEVRGLVTGPNLALQAVVPADVDADGLLDLLVTVFTCDDKSELRVFLNQGDASYAEAPFALGLQHAASLWNVLVTDVDGDRLPDVLTLGESCPPHGGNAYLHNRAFPLTGKGYELLQLPPLFLAPGSEGGSPMGAGVADFDGDGQLDYAFSDIGFRDLRMGGLDVRAPDPKVLAAHANDSLKLLIRKPDGTFENRAVAAGVALALSETGQTMVSWSMRPLDFDFDGRMDLLISHGYDYDAFQLGDEGGMRPVLYRNQGNGTFADVGAAFGLPAKLLGRALVAHDVDGDGDLDLFHGGQSVQPRVLRNDVEHDGHYLTVALRGKVSNPWGLGARVRLETDVRTYVAEMTTNAPSHAMDAPLVHFAVPVGEVGGSLEVAWPSGLDQQVPVAPGLDQHLLVEEPAAVMLSARKIATSADTQVTVQARAYGADGKPSLEAVPTSIELAPGAPGQWLAPTECLPSGDCVRLWQPPTTGEGEAAFVVAFAGKPLSVRPKVRFAPPKWGQ